MNIFITILISLFAAFLAPFLMIINQPKSKALPYQLQIISVKTGSTVRAKMYRDGKVYDIDINALCFDAPEKGKYAVVSQQRLAQLLSGHKIDATLILKASNNQYYGRLNVEGVPVSIQLISEGLADVSLTAPKYCNDIYLTLLNARAAARVNKLGIWSEEK